MAVVVSSGACRGDGEDKDSTAARTSTTESGATTSPAPAGTGLTSKDLAPMPVPRTEVAGAVFDNDRLIVVGGLLPDGGASNRADVYSASRDAWAPGPPLPIGLHHAGAAAVGGRVYVAGGYTNAPGQQWRASARVFSLGPRDAAWREEKTMSPPRGALALAGTETQIVAIGGVVGDDVIRTTDILDLTRADAEWQSGPDLAEAREHLAAAAVGTKVFAIAGRVSGLDRNKATVEVLDTSNLNLGWSAAAELAKARGGTGAAAVGEQVCVTGGEESAGTIASVECLAAGGTRWTTIGSLRQPRHGLAVIGLGGRLHVIGGGPRPGLFVSGSHEAFTLS